MQHLLMWKEFKHQHAYAVKLMAYHCMSDVVRKFIGNIISSFHIFLVKTNCYQSENLKKLERKIELK